jgi:hypothetical protein
VLAAGNPHHHGEVDGSALKSPLGEVSSTGVGAAWSRPVCVLGMHRSGTSLTARLLNVLGLDLGPEETMLPAIEHDNPRGFWEQTAIMTLNDEVLARLGGYWWKLPDLPSDWATSPGLTPLRDKARSVLEECFSGARPWGVKDPRMSVTLPFWKPLVPAFRYVVCMRSPADVAASLERRDSSLHERRSSIDLWLRYTSAALAGTRGCKRIIVFYEDYFRDFDEQLRRLATFLTGTPRVDPEARERARTSFQPDLNHHRSTSSPPLGSADGAAEAAALCSAVRTAVPAPRPDLGGAPADARRIGPRP